MKGAAAAAAGLTATKAFANDSEINGAAFGTMSKMSKMTKKGMS